MTYRAFVSSWYTLAAVAGLVLVSAAPAEAAAPLSGYQVIRRDAPVAAGAFLRDTVLCPSGKVALGGGASVVGSGTADFRTVLSESAPGTIDGGARSLWLVALRNDDTGSHRVGLSATCATRPLGYQVARRDVAVPAGKFLRSTVLCPTGEIALGGGASVVGSGTADFKTVLSESAPGTIGAGGTSRSLWLVALRNRDTARHSVGLLTTCARTR